MHTSKRAAVFALLFGAAFGTSPMAAQEVKSGEEGAPSESRIVDATVLNPGSTQPMDIQFEFTGSEENLRAAILVPGVDLRVELLEPRFHEKTFTFAFQEPGGGDRIECTLFRNRDDSFDGDCMEEGGGAPGQMTLEPTGY